MSAKQVLGGVLFVAGIALAIPTMGASLGLSAMATTLLSAGLLLGASVLLGPSVPKMPESLAGGGVGRLHANLDPTTPRKIVFGHTAMATDVRYQAFTGTNQEYLEQIVCVASHEVQSIDEIWLDNEKVWSASGGIQGDFVGYLTVTTRNPGTSGNGIAIDSVWTASCTLTGCAYVHLKYLLVSEGTETNESPFASGVTSRMTIRGKGAKVYDPRLDSTVAGGSGSHRADNQATWAWSDIASRNPALQLLFYELGWKINGKLAVGKGVPPARLDLASYAVAANACDETVTKSAANGGGTEPRYRSDGVLSEADDPSSVREALCATMNAILRDSGGEISLTVLQDDLASPAASFAEKDVIGPIRWSQTPGIHSIFNIVRGRRIDASDNALYQPVDYPEVKLTSTDGIDRIDTFDLPLVQSNGQAQRLAKQRLQRNQYQGRLSLTGKPSWWQLSLGEVFQFTHSTFGWTNKKFRCAAIKISRSGETEIVAVEEHPDIYSWDNSEAAAVSAPEPMRYNATANHPTNKGINTARRTSVVIDPVNDVIIRADSTGTIKSGELPRQIALTASIGTADVTALGVWSRTVTSGITCTIGAATGVLNITALSSAEVEVPVTFAYNGITRHARVHIVRQDDPPTNSNSGGGGTSGTSASTTTLGATVGTSYDTVNSVSATLTVTAGSAGKVQCSAPISFKRTPGTVEGNTGALGKWQWRVPGGTWADIATEVADSVDARTTYDAEFDTYKNWSGSLSVTQTKTGLTSGTDYEFRFLWRRVDVSGDPDNIYRASGTLAADGTVS